MELREFLKIFIKYKKSFFGMILIFILSGVTYFFLQPENFKTSLTLNISRSSQFIESQEYAYDDFYRLQADERFADTVVRWLDSPRVVENILREAGFINLNNQNLSDKQLRGFFTAKRMSSQVIDLTFITTNVSQATELADAIKMNLNSETEKLNEKQKQEGWFIILGDEPVITSNEKGLLFLVALSGMTGLFVAFFITMFRFYWEEER